MAINEIRANGVGDTVTDDSGVTFTRVETDGLRVLEIRGDLDIAVSGRFGHELDELLDLGEGRVAADLSGVLFMDSSALSALVQARERAKATGQQFTLRNPSPACAKVLALTGLDRVFDEG